MSFHMLSSGIHLLMRGGFMMIPLLIAALIGLTIILERTYLLIWKYRTPHCIIEEILKSLPQHSKIPQLQTPLISLLKIAQEHWDAPFEHLENHLQVQAQEWVFRLEKHISVLDTIITAAPLMGLLGTILGMMSSFHILANNASHYDPYGLTGGVAEALIATATGLGIALLCLVAYNYLNHQVKTSLYHMEMLSAQILQAKQKYSHDQTSL